MDKLPRWINDDRDGQNNDIFLGHQFPEAKSSNKTWYYHDRLRHYLLAIAKDKNAVESIYKFPESIRPPESWNKLFKQMAKLTKKTGHEWYCGIATDRYGNVLLPNHELTLKGNKDSVTSDMQIVHEGLLHELGADTIIGDIHTHPTEWKFKSLVDRFSLLTASFSAVDLYSLTYAGSTKIMGVLQGDQAVFAFRSRESSQNENLDYLPKGFRDCASFADYWYRTVGLQYQKETQIVKSVKGEISHDEWIKLIWKATVNAAQKHDLAMYRGHIGFSLHREFPAPV